MTETNVSSRTSTSKRKGSAYENKVARELGTWMFNDKDTFCRHLTSGAQKSVYVGDIVPQKNIPLHFNNGVLPFLIECKNGYKSSIPNLNNQTIIRQWLGKALNERTENQSIIYLIVSFHAYTPLLITDVPFNLTANLILNYFENDNTIQFHIYDYRKLLQYDFYSLYENNQYIIEKLNKKSP